MLIEPKTLVVGDHHRQSNTLLKSDVTRRDHVVHCLGSQPNVGSRFVNFVVNFIRDGTVFA